MLLKNESQTMEPNTISIVGIFQIVLLWLKDLDGSMAELAEPWLYCVALSNADLVWQ